MGLDFSLVAVAFVEVYIGGLQRNMNERRERSLELTDDAQLDKDLSWMSANRTNGLPALNWRYQAGGASGFADTFVVPVNLGWHFSRADFNVGYGFFAPTGRYTPGASNNVGSGYWGFTILSGTTFYITKDKGTSGRQAEYRLHPGG